VGSRQVLGEKNVDAQGFRQGGHGLLAGIGQGVNSVLGQVCPEKQGKPCNIDQYNYGYIEDIFKIMFSGWITHCVSLVLLMHNNIG